MDCYVSFVCCGLMMAVVLCQLVRNDHCGEHLILCSIEFDRLYLRMQLWMLMIFGKLISFCMGSVPRALKMVQHRIQLQLRHRSAGYASGN